MVTVKEERSNKVKPWRQPRGVRGRAWIMHTRCAGPLARRQTVPTPFGQVPGR